MLSRIFRGENENAASKRKRQIDTLKIFNDNVLELQEDVEYQVQFDAGDKRMAIMVSLSPEFPLEKPVLRVSPPIIHKWCNEHSEIVSAPGLLNFTVHSDLGRVVQVIIREFSKNPPQLVESNSPVSSMSLADLGPNPWSSHELPSTSYNAYFNSYPYSSANATQNIFNYNFTNASNSYNVNDQANQKPYTPPGVPYLPNSVSTIPFNTTTAQQQYSSSPGASGYSNLHYVNSNAGTTLHQSQEKYKSALLQNQEQYKSALEKSQEQYKNALHDSNFPELLSQAESQLKMQLQNTSTDELRKLGEDEDLLDQYLSRNLVIQGLDFEVENQIDLVEETATKNLSKEQELEELREDLNGKKQTIEQLRANYEKLIEQYNKLSEVFEPENICDGLKKAADESQEQSEAIAQDFLNRKIDVERFLSTYIECRKLGQARRTKEEKLTHQLNELKRSAY